MSSGRKINFAAGPAKIPEEVLITMQAEQLNYHNLGMSVIEMSHRSKEFGLLLNETKSLLREIMNIPENFEILFMQGGGSGQFAAIPLNLKGDNEHADYIVTGAWSAKAAEEAEKYINVKKVYTPSKPYVTIPDQENWVHDEKAAYLYYCANETVHGIEFTPKAPEGHNVPLIADVSSNFLARPFDFTDHGVVFGGTQKNLGAAGLTIVIVRKDLIGKQLPFTPAVFSYKEMIANNSLYNTPPTGGIYTTNLVLKWIKQKGGLQAIYENNLKKSSLIYTIIEESNDFYYCAVDIKYRSIMNVCFRIGGQTGNEELEAAFLTGATERNMMNLKGHRSVGGIRASLYNAITFEETKVLADWMIEFKNRHQH